MSNAEVVVQRQLEAYNARNLEAFAATYASDVRLWRLPDTQPVLDGIEQLREHYGGKTFQREGLRAEIMSRITLGSKVVDHERCSWHGLAEPIEVLAIYDVRGGLIRNVWFAEP